MLGAATVRPMVERLLPGAHVLTRPRLSQLTFAGEKKLTRLPRRSAVVAFSAEEVYAIAELIRRQRGGAAVVLGALSPRTRNAQVALYQSGDVEYMVATDAIGMGLNLDVDHLAFASDRKFDGYQFRKLNPVRAGADRRPRRPRHPRRHLRHHRPLPAVRDRARAGAGEPFVRAAQAIAVAQHRARFHLGRRAAGVALGGAEGERAHPRAGGRGHPGARPRLARRRRARDGDDAGGGGAAVGGLPGPRLPQDLARVACRAGDDAVRLPDARAARSRSTGSPSRSSSPTTTTATSTRCRTASRISAPGPSPPTGPTGSPIPSTGRA